MIVTTFTHWQINQLVLEKGKVIVIVAVQLVISLPPTQRIIGFVPSQKPPLCEYDDSVREKRKEKNVSELLESLKQKCKCSALSHRAGYVLFNMCWWHFDDVKGHGSKSHRDKTQNVTNSTRKHGICIKGFILIWHSWEKTCLPHPYSSNLVSYSQVPLYHLYSPWW